MGTLDDVIYICDFLAWLHVALFVLIQPYLKSCCLLAPSIAAAVSIDCNHGCTGYLEGCGLETSNRALAIDVTAVNQL